MLNIVSLILSIVISTAILFSIPSYNYLMLINADNGPKQYTIVQEKKKAVNRNKPKPKTKKRIQRQRKQAKPQSKPMFARQNVSMDFDVGAGSGDGVAIGGMDGGSGAFGEGDVDQPAQFLSGSTLTLPDEVTKMGLSGEVVYVVTVGPNGLVEAIEVEKQPAGFDFTPVLKDLSRSWKYKPAMVQGLPVKMSMRENFEF